VDKVSDEDEGLPSPGNDAAEMIAEYEALSPEAASAFVEMLERRRRAAAWAEVSATIRQMGRDNAVQSILRRQAQSMDAIKGSFEEFTLLPDFSGDDFSQLESAVLSLMPTTAEEVENIERAVVDTSADPESRKIIARLAEHLPNRSEVATMTTWAGFLAVALYLMEMAPEIDPNRIAMLAVIVAVWTVIVQRHGSR
jgi:hypothetical protein